MKLAGCAILHFDCLTYDPLGPPAVGELGPNLANKFGNCCSAGQDRKRSAIVVRKHVVRVDTEELVDRGQNVLGQEGSFYGVFTVAIRCADHLAHLHTTSIDQRATGVSPVITARYSVKVANAWGPTKLARDH